MTKEFKLPELGENIDSIQVVNVLVSPGGTVAIDQPVLELETDKATIDVPSTVAGTVASVHVNPGDAIKTGQLIFSLSESSDAPQESENTESAPTEEPTPAPAKVGDTEDLSAEEPLKDASATEAVEPAVSTAPPHKKPELPAPSSTAGKVPAAPSVRRFAREIGIDLTQVSGSGPHGRVSKDDVKRFSKRLNESCAAGPVPGIATVPPLPDFTRWGQVERKKMSVIRSKTAEHLSLSWSQVPHVTIYDKADISELEVLRKKYAALTEKYGGGKLTMAVMVCKIVAHALRRFPIFNSSADMTTREIVFKDYVHLGVAVNTERGLMVPAVRDADKKNMLQLAAEVHELAGKCRDGKIKLEEIEGSTFTVTNLGRICGTFFTPIVNYPEVAILGLGRALDEPQIVEGAVAARTMLPLSLSFDHRVIDGADGAQFLGWIKEAIEQPLMLALDG